MDDRSFHARDVSQSVIVTGDGNQVRLSFGDSGMVLPLLREQFHPPQRLGPGAQGRPARELDILNPTAGKLPFVGRDDLLGKLRAWLEGEQDISVHALTGRAGTGKTRLAMELCAAVDSDLGGKGPWLAGFLSPSGLAAVVETLATRSFTWERQTLLVLDYAAQCSKPLGRWLDRLAHQRLDTKLRILLLEREVPDGFGWWHDLAAPALHGEQARLDLFHALCPRPLPDLASLEERRWVMTAALRAARALRPEASLTGDVPGHGKDTAFDAHLAQPQFGSPLALVMAGVIALDNGPLAALALRRLDAARQLGCRELHRLMAMAESRSINGETMRHLVAFNGLAGGLPFAGRRGTVAAELAASHRQADLDALVSLLEQELPPRAAADGTVPGRLATIQPDLIGEAAIIEALSGAPVREAEAPGIVSRAYALGQDGAAQALVRLVQDYAYALEEQGATAEEKVTACRVMDWLLTLARGIADTERLVPLVEALPLNTIVLREAAADLTQRLADHYSHAAKGSDDLSMVENAAVWIGNLATRLSDLGQREVALGAGEEAVQLRRALAQARPDAFTPHLAALLNNLAIMLSALGRREAALAAAEEAVQLYRALAQARPGAFTPNLAGSLNTLAIMLSALGRREAALAAIEAAVQLRRALAQAQPDAFIPDLAMSLNTLAIMLSALGRREAALAAIEEAVQLRRALAQARPDAFTPELAMSLNNLATMLSALNRHKAALAAVEEAVQFRRALAQARPDPFTPDLAASFNNLANMLSALGRREAALAAAQEAVQLYRALAQARPGAFTPNSAMSLITLGNMFRALGRREAALAATEEAVQLYRTLAQARPDAFTPDFAASLNNLAAMLSDLGRREAALAAAEETVQLYRALTQARPDAFTPDLAMSLNNLANRLSDLSQHELALAAAEETVQLYRALAQAHPDAFTPDLATSLWVLGDLFAEIEDPRLAILTLQEAIERLVPAFTTVPMAHSQIMVGLLQSYISHCETLGFEPDTVLLAPVLEILERLQSKGEEE